MTAAIDPVDEFLNLDAWPLSPEEDYSSSGNDSGDQRHSHHRDLPFSQSSISSSSSSSSPHSPGESYMVGFLIVNVVGIQYYNGTINGREMVGLVREPLNAYDENAIKVLNTRSVQVGHIERMAAKVLAPMIDSRLIAVEGMNFKGNSRIPLIFFY